MTPEELVDRYPHLYHLSAGGSWPTIRRLGLLTTEQIVDRYASEPDGDLLLRRRRSASHTLRHPVDGTFVIRDQKPLMERNLRLIPDDLTVGAWLQELNTRVFFWLHPRRLNNLVNAKAGRDGSHDVLVLDTAALIETHHENVRVTGMNTGSTIFPRSPARGRGTFMTVEEFPFDERRRRGKALHENVVELAVTGGVPDVANFVLRVEERLGSAGGSAGQ